MALLKTLVNKFNRGEIDKRALAREDVEKISNSGELVENFMPIRLGPMMYRPGTEKLDTVPGQAYFVPFVRATDEVAGLELTDQQLRVWVDDAPVSRPAVTCSITNPDFTSNLSGWTDASGTGSSTSHDASGYAVITGTGTTRGILYQQVTTSSVGTQHALRLVVLDAPVTLRLGKGSAGDDSYFAGTLLPGTHSLAFTPDAANFFIQLENDKDYSTLVDSVDIEGSGEMTLPCAVVEADLSKIRFAQSADIVYMACEGYAQFQIERRGETSWSIVDYRADDGPFELINNTDVSMTAGAISGNTTLTASRDYFSENNVGQLFKVDSAGQVVEADVSAEGSGTNSIRVTGVGNARKFTISRQGTWNATVTLQRSSDDLVWQDVETYTANGIKTFDDGFDNSEFYYRLWIKTGDYTSGTAELTLTYPGGSISGICRVIQFNSATEVDIQILQDMGSTIATRDWYPGSWSVGNGYPSAVSLYEGRLWWAGFNKVWGSVSDAYTSFERIEDEGAASSIQRTIGFGPVDNVLWLAPSSRLLMGLASDEVSVRSSSFGEVLTQANVNLKSGSSSGAAPRMPLVIDGVVYYVQRSGTKLHAMEYNVSNDSHESVDLMTLHQRIAEGGITRIAVTRQPETRIFCVLDTGEARVYLLDKSEDVAAWSRVTTPSGSFEDVYVLPGTAEDRVYFVVNRGGTRYHEKLALFSESEGGSLSKNYDAHVVYTSPGTTLTGLGHLEGLTVSVWADGQHREDQTVSGGQITVSASWTDVVVGLRHTAKWKSGKVAGYSKYSVMAERKRVTKTALVMSNYWPGSVKTGESFDAGDLQPMEDIAYLPDDSVIEDYNEVEFNFNGRGVSDPRVCIQADNPTTILALVVHVKDTVRADE